MVLGVDVVNAYFSPIDVISEVVQFNVEMLRPRAVLVMFGHFDRATVIFEDLTEYISLSLRDWESMVPQLLHRLDYRDCIPQGIRQTGVFAFS